MGKLWTAEWAMGLKRYGKYYEGIVESAELVLEMHKQDTISTFGIWRTERPRSAPAVGKENIVEQGTENKDSKDKLKVMDMQYWQTTYSYMYNFQQQPNVKIYWKQTVGDTVIEFNGVPFCPIKTQTFDCQHGKQCYSAFPDLCRYSKVALPYNHSCNIIRYGMPTVYTSAYQKLKFQTSCKERYGCVFLWERSYKGLFKRSQVVYGLPKVLPAAF